MHQILLFLVLSLFFQTYLFIVFFELVAPNKLTKVSISQISYPIEHKVILYSFILSKFDYRSLFSFNSFYLFPNATGFCGFYTIIYMTGVWKGFRKVAKFVWSDGTGSVIGMYYFISTVVYTTSKLLNNCILDDFLPLHFNIVVGFLRGIFLYLINF